MRRDARGREQGSATIWVLACCVLLTVVAGVATIRSLAVLARHRAEAGADLAALAAAGQIGISERACAPARRVASRNGGRLRTCRLDLDPDGRSGTVAVRVSVVVNLPLVGGKEVVATARAGRLASADHAVPP